MAWKVVKTKNDGIDATAYGATLKCHGKDGTNLHLFGKITLMESTTLGPPTKYKLVVCGETVLVSVGDEHAPLEITL